MSDLEIDTIFYPPSDSCEYTKMAVIEGWYERLNDVSDEKRKRFQCFIVTQDLTNGTCQVHARFTPIERTPRG